MTLVTAWVLEMRILYKFHQVSSQLKGNPNTFTQRLFLRKEHGDDDGLTFIPLEWMLAQFTFLSSTDAQPALEAVLMYPAD